MRRRWRGHRLLDLAEELADADGDLSLRGGARDGSARPVGRQQLRLLDLPPLRRAVDLLPGVDGPHRGGTQGDARLRVGQENDPVRPLRHLRLRHVLAVGLAQAGPQDGRERAELRARGAALAPPAACGADGGVRCAMRHSG